MNRFTTVLILIAVLMGGGCSNRLLRPESYEITWAYQSGERRLNFKNVRLVYRNGRRVIVGRVENVGEDPWLDPTVRFVLLNRDHEVLGTASTRRYERLEVGEVWLFTVTSDEYGDFHRARFDQPTGWR